jgi:hypothetical protein
MEGQSASPCNTMTALQLDCKQDKPNDVNQASDLSVIVTAVHALAPEMSSFDILCPLLWMGALQRLRNGLWEEDAVYINDGIT